MARVVLNVPDISCEHCQNTITKALKPIEGVQGVNVDIPTKQVTVEYDEAAIGVDRIEDILEEEDYPVESASPA